MKNVGVPFTPRHGGRRSSSWTRRDGTPMRLRRCGIPLAILRAAAEEVPAHCGVESPHCLPILPRIVCACLRLVDPSPGRRGMLLEQSLDLAFGAGEGGQ